jgi:tripeptide aminopeptidase
MSVLLSPSMLEQIKALAAAHTEAAAKLAQQICAIPAPTGSERQRAEFIAAYLRERGYSPEIDEISNVYTRRGKRGSGPLLMLLAHTDTVFPMSTPLKIQREGDIVRGPGIGDNSMSVAAMLTLLNILDELNWETEVDIMAVANVGEEGLGNLRGARAAVERYRKELSARETQLPAANAGEGELQKYASGAVLAIDGRLGYVVNAGVGSQRWRITVRGPGGHSFGSFGTPSAIHGLGKIIAAIADVQVPTEPRTTFNVGMVEGGTSVNSIAASASALLDMRSTDIVALERLTEQMRAIILKQPGPGAGLTAEIEVLGERPAGQRPADDPLVQLAVRAANWVDVKPQVMAASTDVNIPISLGIPAVCVGVTYGERAHTLEEFIQVPPISKGLAQVLRLCLEATQLLEA